MKEDTIAAVATPPGVGAISIIRVSGPDSYSVADQIFKGKVRISECKSHTVHYGTLRRKDGQIIDDVLVSVFKSPNSYTCEDSVEFSIHGSQHIAKSILEELVEYGVRLAEPGEFTKRAFINGRIDLAQAEAVADVIRANTDVSLRGARNQLDGLLSIKINEFRIGLIDLSSFLELELDFSEEDISFIERNKLGEKLDNIIFEIDALLKTYSFGKVIKDGVNIAIVGQPNVGKSSLLNYILKESRAIVSQFPGTTRDVIREEAFIDDVFVRLFDTAGIRKSEDEIELEGIIKTREVIKNADLVLVIGDTELGYSNDLLSEVKQLNSNRKVLKILNKIDLKKSSSFDYDLKISAKTGEGILELLKKIKDISATGSNYTEKTAIINNLRHYNSLNQAKNYLLNAKKSIQQKLSAEFVSADLRNAENSLAEIIGVITSDDVLNNIFSKFCIGK